jgi:hypothetical protein
MRILTDQKPPKKIIRIVFRAEEGEDFRSEADGRACLEIGIDKASVMNRRGLIPDPANHRGGQREEAQCHRGRFFLIAISDAEHV